MAAHRAGEGAAARLTGRQPAGPGPAPTPRRPAATAAERYARLEAARRPFVDRAEEAARLTIPALMPREAHAATSSLETPFQGVGARGVNNLANKFLLAQFPPNARFFRLEMDPSTRARLGPPDAERDGRLEENLREIERRVSAALESGPMRLAMHAALRQLIVTGNALVHSPADGALRVFRLDRYVVRRDPSGRLLELVVKEAIAAEATPPEVRDALGLAPGEAAGPAEKSLDLFTHVERGPSHWRVRQEINGQIVPGSEGGYPLDQLEWLPLRWTQVDGEDYGRGHVEEYLGDLISLEGLSRAIVEGAAIGAKMTILVSPNGQTDAEELAESENGGIIDGDAKDVSVLQAGRFNDFRVALEAMTQITERLSFAFMMTPGFKRDGARATAEEVRFLARELEDTLGGVYSMLAQELQAPLVALSMRHLMRRGAVPPLPDGLLTPVIMTGLDALGRGRDLERLERFARVLAALTPLLAGPFGARLDPAALMRRTADALGVDLSDLTAAPRPEGEADAQALVTAAAPAAEGEDGGAAAEALFAALQSAVQAGETGAA